MLPCLTIDTYDTTLSALLALPGPPPARVPDSSPSLVPCVVYFHHVRCLYAMLYYHHFSVKTRPGSMKGLPPTPDVSAAAS